MTVSLASGQRTEGRASSEGALAEVPFVSYVIPVRNDAARLRRCLRSLDEMKYPKDRCEIVVIDNGSNDGSADVAREAGARVLTVTAARVAELRNLAASSARGEIIAFVDADHELNAEWLESAVETLCRPGVAGVGAQYYGPPNGTWVQRMYDSFRQRRAGIHDVEWVGSGSLAVWRSVFEAEGGFDTRLETCEDVDFCNRLRAAGRRLVSDGRLVSVHLGDPTTLKSVFLGELWRGRDNLRVSLRGPVTLRAMPSVVIPVLNLTALTVAVGGLVAAPWGGVPLVAYSVAMFVGLALFRTGRMLVRLRSLRPKHIAQAFAVAAVYELARCLALVTRAPHALRRRSDA